MAKVARSYTFSNATLYKEDGGYVLTEYTKDDMKDFNFSQILDDLINTEGLAITIKQQAELNPVDPEPEQGSEDVIV